MYSRGQKIGPGNRTESRRDPVSGRQQSCLRHGEQAGHHRGLRSGHAFRGVIRELERTSRLLGSNCRSRGDRRKQHPVVCRSTRTANEAKDRRDLERANTSLKTMSIWKHPNWCSDKPCDWMRRRNSSLPVRAPMRSSRANTANRLSCRQRTKFSRGPNSPMSRSSSKKPRLSFLSP